MDDDMRWKIVGDWLSHFPYYEVVTETLTSRDQSWFWSDEWQVMEDEAGADLAEGRFKTFDSFEDFMLELNTYDGS